VGLSGKDMKRGYFGIGIYHPKTTENVGTLWRSAHNFGADFIFTIGRRYKKQASDTTKAERHVPLYEYATFEDFKKHLPRGCQLVFIEQTDGSKDLKTAAHPETAAYILGAEDYGVPQGFMRGYQKLHIETPMCINVAVAGSIVLYDRAAKS
jgi:tRNA(Leu) C34 or U34 (ribose-2'-O)-methylase TrmL